MSLEEKCSWYGHMIHQGATSKNSAEYDLLLKNKQFNICLDCEGKDKNCSKYSILDPVVKYGAKK